MTAKRKVIVACSVAGLLALAAVLTGMAFGPPSFCGGKFHQFIVANIDDRVEELELTPAQEKQYQALRSRFVKNLEQAGAKRREAMRLVAAELEKKNPDVKAVTGLVKSRLNGIPEFMSVNMDLLAEFYEILDDKQKAKVLNRARKRMQRFNQFCLEG